VNKKLLIELALLLAEAAPGINVHSRLRLAAWQCLRISAPARYPKAGWPDVLLFIFKPYMSTVCRRRKAINYEVFDEKEGTDPDLVIILIALKEAGTSFSLK
jgi:hypothetical protein